MPQHRSTSNSWIFKLVQKLLRNKPKLQHQQKSPDFHIEAESGLPLRLCLITQGTTANFYLSIGIISAYIDGRETYENKYIVKEDLKKYEMYGQKILVAFVGDVRIGRGVLRYLKELMESNKPKSNMITVDLLSRWVQGYIPTTYGATDIVILGFSATGVPLISHLVISRSESGRNVDVVPHVDEECISLGSGENHETLKVAIANLDVASTERIFGIAMAKAIVKDPHTGGFISTLDMHFRGRRVQTNTSIDTSISYMIKYFDRWVEKSMLYLLYPREIRDSRFFHRWVGKQLARKMATIDFKMSTIAKLQSVNGEELAFAVINLNLEQYASFIIEKGQKNRHLLSGFEVYEYQSKYQSDLKNFYVMQPSLNFLSTMGFEYIIEYALAKEESDRNEEAERRKARRT